MRVKTLKHVSLSYVAYVCLLLAFVALGMFVYALAARSALAGVTGAAFVASLGAAVAGFRAGARKLAVSNESGNPIDGVNIWASPLRREEIDRYLSKYRGSGNDGQHQGEVVTVASRPIARQERWAA